MVIPAPPARWAGVRGPARCLANEQAAGGAGVRGPACTLARCFCMSKWPRQGHVTPERPDMRAWLRRPRRAVLPRALAPLLRAAGAGAARRSARAWTCWRRSTARSATAPGGRCRTCASGTLSCWTTRSRTRRSSRSTCPMPRPRPSTSRRARARRRAHRAVCHVCIATAPSRGGAQPYRSSLTPGPAGSRSSGARRPPGAWQGAVQRVAAAPRGQAARR